ncbi:MAG: histidine kinase [Pseudomonadota bacterium]
MQKTRMLLQLAKAMMVTALFNTAVALALSFFILRDRSHSNLIVCSNLIGFSIFTCVRVARHLVNRFDTIKPALGKATGVFCGIIIGSLSSWCYLYLTWQMAPVYFIKNVLFYLAGFGIFFGLPMVYYFSSQKELVVSRQRIQEEKIRRLSIEKEATMTSLRLLQAQIEPHFLFNTLATVLSLFETDIEKARTMLLDLNVFLHACLEYTRKEMVTLAKELEITAHYLNIFRTRMGERLSYSIEDRTGSPELPFPPMIIQPLVENSIKYGLEPKPEGGSIAILCTRVESTLEIVIRDTGLGLEDTTLNAGVGLDNVSRRLASLYGDKAGFTINSAEPCGTQVTIRINQ